MTPKGKKFFIFTIVLAVLMFVWIGIAVAVTGGRDVGEFTDRDLRYMMVFAVAEGLTVIALFVFAVLTGKENQKARPPMPQKPQTKSEKTIRARGIGLAAASLALSLGFDILGIKVGKSGMGIGFDGGIWVCLAVGAALLGLNLLLYMGHVRKLKNQQVAQLHRFILSHREEAEKTAEEKRVFVRRWKRLSDLYAAVLFALGAAGAFCAGVAYNGNTNTTGILLAALLILSALSRIRFSVPKSVFSEDRTYVDPQDYPILYRIAQKAADTVGCPGRIRIALIPTASAGIAKTADGYSVQMGVLLLKTVTEEELNQILLHEFSHMIQEKAIGQKELEYCHWLQYRKTPHFYSGITNLFFVWLDTVYIFQFGLYQYAASIQIETQADQAMVRWGDPETAASSLVKLKYYDLFVWEQYTEDEIPAYLEEEPGRDLLSQELRRFHKAMQTRAEAWNRLIGVEILSRSASHPTIRMRLEGLGVPEPRVLPLPEPSQYTAECDRALAYVDGLICENRKEGYEEKRKAHYLEPKAQVEAWEAAGKPVNAEQYGDMVWNLRCLGRTREAIALCDRVIEMLPNEANHQAYFIRGCCRLHRYEEAGLEDIYFAIENNHNYIEEGLDEIGQFCCLTGNQQELDIYREKAVALAQRQKDDYNELSYLNKGDKLSPEQLPDGMLEGILAYVRSIDREGSIEKIYLVRKTITDTFFCSPVVVKFRDGAPEETCDEILHKIFRYLDTCSDWQFSLFRYEEVAKAKVEAIENSCVYSKNP